MKVWIEFPEETKFARQPRDVLYTPIYFANEKITAHLRLDSEWKTTFGEELDRLFNARAKLIGKASLGFLSIGGNPVSSLDMRYAIPNLGFKPIYTLEILNLHKRITLANLEYDAEDGVRGGRTPFTFQLPTSTLDDLQQLASSLKVITADNTSTMSLLQGITPALIVSVQYLFVVEILDENAQVKATTSEEIRIFVSLSQEQVPASTDPAVASNPMAQFVDTQVVSFSSSRNRRGSIPLIRRLSRTSVQDTNLVTVSVDHVEPFTFSKQSDAAPSKATISLVYTSDTTTNPPPPIFGSIKWMLKSLTTLTLEPVDRGEDTTRPDDFFHLRAKCLPSRKLDLKWFDWQLQPGSTGSGTRWKSTQHIWLIKDLTAGMTPTFITPYLSHTYLLNLQINLVENEARMGRSLSSSSKQRVELDVPAQVRYELGLVPSYEIDETLPQYDHTLPEYEENEGGNGVVVVDDDEAVAEAADADVLQGFENLNLNLVATRDEDGVIPLRSRNHSPQNRTEAGGVVNR